MCVRVWVCVCVRVCVGVWVCVCTCVIDVFVFCVHVVVVPRVCHYIYSHLFSKGRSHQARLIRQLTNLCLFVTDH